VLEQAGGVEHGTVNASVAPFFPSRLCRCLERCEAEQENSRVAILREMGSEFAQQYPDPGKSRVLGYRNQLFVQVCGDPRDTAAPYSAKNTETPTLCSRVSAFFTGCAILA
jgi:hypothetical protein